MSDPTDDGRPRPVPRPRPGGTPRAGTARPSPRPRVAGARRDREAAPSPAPKAAPKATGPQNAAKDAAKEAAKDAARGAVPRRTKAERRTAASGPVATARAKGSRATRAAAIADPPARRSRRGLVAVLLVLCLAALAAGGVLLWQRLDPRYVDPTVFAATQDGVEALYAYDYKDSDGSVRRKLAVLTGPLREQYKQDLSQGGIIDTYEQVSATTSYDVLDVGLQQINEAQDTATLVVFGQYVVKSVNSGQSQAPAGSECQTTSDGAQSCTQTVQVGVTKVDGDWKIDELTLLTTS